MFLSRPLLVMFRGRPRRLGKRGLSTVSVAPMRSQGTSYMRKLCKYGLKNRGIYSAFPAFWPLNVAKLDRHPQSWIFYAGHDPPSMHDEIVWFLG